MTTLKALQAYSSALLAEECLAGTFHYDLVTGELQWSEEIYLIHGYRRGEVVPTVDLLMSHKHPEDRDRCRENFEVCRGAGFFASYHRLIDARRRERRVLTAGEAVPDDSGRPLFIDGFVLDLTKTLQLETDRTAREAIAGAIGTRGLIEQAKGILMGILHIGSNAAFERLSAYSQHHNIKIAHAAAAIVRLANDTQESATLDGVIHTLDGIFAAHQTD
ncbi:ANTAR domain-containing protein [Arthrobacter sp. PAMC25564]|uniref:PAS and ANTAR domain-containing protein n=1 Tax=Arthrobacter sp. PAMC25564 TaxID=2565366 RepID=UPI0010A21539|nr:PAS and ANTAR domain-containing protein [Arthrobacter sp. PAMC25564]QCB97095.1 ANTAR domain-containing protein [Arthrobacter sp. PAMC25564]